MWVSEMALLQRGPPHTSLCHCLRNGSASVSSTPLNPDPLHARSRLAQKMLPPLPQCSFQQHLPGRGAAPCARAPGAHRFLPPQLTPEKHTFSCHQAKLVSKSCVESALRSLPLLLRVTKRSSPGALGRDLQGDSTTN